jgi:hypothetical protein
MSAQPDAAAQAVKALTASDSTLFRVSMLREIVESPQGARHLPELAKGDDAAAALARLELARADGKAVAQAAAAAIELGHPIVISYVAERARLDAAAQASQAAEAYSPALMRYVRETNPTAARMERDHMYAAQVAGQLIEMGHEPTISEMERILGGKYMALQRVVGTGLMRAKPCEASRRLAAVAMKSEYQEIYIDGVLAAGEALDESAREHLKRIVADPQRHSVPLAVQAAWRLVRLDNAAATTAAELAKTMKE